MPLTNRLGNQECRELLMLMLTAPMTMNRGRWRLFLGKTHPLADKSGYCWRNRLVAQVALRRKLLPTEHVHHINRIKTDDRPENFEVLDCVYHGKLHASALLVARFERGKLRDLEDPIGPFNIKRDKAVLGEHVA